MGEPSPAPFSRKLWAWCMGWLLMFLGATWPAETPEVARHCEFTSNGRETLRVTLAPSEAAQVVNLGAGLVFQRPDGQRVMTLRAASLSLQGPGQGVGSVATAALSTQNAGGAETAAVLTGEPEPRLEPLLKYLKEHGDVAQLTSQCVAFALLENVSFAQWLAFLRSGVPVADEAALAKVAGEAVARGIDALAVLKAIAPGRELRLFQDDELRLRALRSPMLRGRAQLVYGLSIPELAPVPPSDGLAPRMPFHQQPDNCPACQMRQRMQRGSDL